MDKNGKATQYILKEKGLNIQVFAFSEQEVNLNLWIKIKVSHKQD